MNRFTALTLSAFAAPMVVPVTAGLLAHYPLDGNANDAGPGGHHLTAYAAIGGGEPEFHPAGGRLGGFARFDGTCLLNTPWLPVSGNADRTLMGFLRSVSDNEPNPATATQFFAGWGSPETSARIRFDLGFQNNSNAQLRNEYNSGFTLSAAAAEPLNLGRWHHFAVVWTAADLAATFYLDGLPFGSAVANGTLNTGGGAVDIGLTLGADTRAAGRLSGASGQTPNRYFRGDLDEVRVYDHALSAAEVADYFNGVQRTGPAIVFLEPDLPLSAPGEARTLRYQLSGPVTAAFLNQGIGSVLPVDSLGFGKVTVTPESATVYRLTALRDGQETSVEAEISVQRDPVILSVRHRPGEGTSRLRLFLPRSVGGHSLQRTDDPGTGWPDLPGIFPAAEGSVILDFADLAAPPVRGFYRLRRE